MKPPPSGSTPALVMITEQTNRQDKDSPVLPKLALLLANLPGYEPEGRTIGEQQTADSNRDAIAHSC